MLTLMIPSGIGDFAAMYSKLCCLEREIVVIPTGDGPRRIGPFLDILPKIKNGGYGHFTTGPTLQYTLPPGVDLRDIADGEYFLSINAWIDFGGKVADWIPGPVDYHYEFSTEAEKLELPRKLIADISKEHEGPIIGVYTSGYGNSTHWGFWEVAAWFKFLKMIRSHINAHFVFIGADFDVGMGNDLHALCCAEGIPATSTIGAFHIGSTIELMRQLDYFFAFPSGLGFLADVVNVPHVMWFPPHLKTMHGTFCDPANYESGRTQHHIFETPEEAYKNFVEVGSQFLSERIVCL